MFASLTATPLSLLFVLLCFHTIMDFALQTEWIATNKNPRARMKFAADERDRYQVIWPHLLTAHSMHHGLAVYVVTQNFTLGIAETIVHWITDFGKCQAWYGFHIDQFIHILTKILWTFLIWKGIVS